MKEIMLDSGEIIKYMVMTSRNGVTAIDMKEISNGFDRGRGSISRIK